MSFLSRISLVALFLVLTAATDYSLTTDPGDLLWQSEIGGEIWSPISHHSGVLYFGTDDHNFYAFDIAGRAIEWQFETTGIIRSGAAFSDGLVSFASDDGMLYALSAEAGTLQWQFDLGSGDSTRVHPDPGPPYRYDYRHSTPISDGNRLFVGSATGKLFAIDQKTGTEAWSFQSGYMIRSTPVVQDNLVIFGSWDGYVYALDVETGDEVWTFNTGGAIQSSPAIGAGTVFIGSRSAAVFALDVRTGQLKWKHQHLDGSWVESSPVYEDGVVYAGTSDSLKLFAFDAETGDIVWEYFTGGWSWSNPQVAGDKVYIGSVSAFPYYVEGIDLKGGFYAVDKSSGQLAWEMAPGPIQGYITGGVLSTSTVADGVVYVGGLDGNLYALQHD